jgi:hypothetical protein
MAAQRQKISNVPLILNVCDVIYCMQEYYAVCGTSLPSYLPISMNLLRRPSSLLAAEPRPSYTVDSGMNGLMCEDNPFIHEECRKQSSN